MSKVPHEVAAYVAGRTVYDNMTRGYLNGQAQMNSNINIMINNYETAVAIYKKEIADAKTAISNYEETVDIYNSELTRAQQESCFYANCVQGLLAVIVSLEKFARQDDLETIKKHFEAQPKLGNYADGVAKRNWYGIFRAAFVEHSKKERAEYTRLLLCQLRLLLTGLKSKIPQKCLGRKITLIFCVNINFKTRIPRSFSPTAKPNKQKGILLISSVALA